MTIKPKNGAFETKKLPRTPKDSGAFTTFVYPQYMSAKTVQKVEGGKNKENWE